MLDTVATNNLENNALSLQTKDSNFKTMVTNLNADKKGLNVDEIIDAIKTVIVEVIDLKITTWVMVLNNQVDQRTQKRAIKEIEALGGKVITTTEGANKILFPPKD